MIGKQRSIKESVTDYAFIHPLDEMKLFLCFCRRIYLPVCLYDCSCYTAKGDVSYLFFYQRERERAQSWNTFVMEISRRLDNSVNKVTHSYPQRWSFDTRRIQYSNLVSVFFLAPLKIDGVILSPSILVRRCTRLWVSERACACA